VVGKLIFVAEAREVNVAPHLRPPAKVDEKAFHDLYPKKAFNDLYPKSTCKLLMTFIRTQRP